MNRETFINKLTEVFDSVCVWRRDNARWEIYTETCKLSLAADGWYTVYSETLNSTGVSDCGWERCYRDVVGTAKALYC